MRAPLVVVLVGLAGCTLGAGGPDRVTARPPPDPDRMPTAVLDTQDPAADTSKNPVLSRTSAHYVDPSDGKPPWLGCLRLLSCGTTAPHDASGVLVVLAALAATRRRRKTS